MPTASRFHRPTPIDAPFLVDARLHAGWPALSPRYARQKRGKHGARRVREDVPPRLDQRGSVLPPAILQFSSRRRRYTYLMKDVTSTSFGLLIAFLLPGAAALYVGSYWSTRLERVFEVFLTAQSTVGLFFVLTLAALVIGLQITLLRWLIFEKWFAKKSVLGATDFAALKDDQVLTAFRAAVDEHYRYHQFWGGIAIVLPLVILTVLSKTACSLAMFVITAALIGMEVLTCVAAQEAYARYIARAKAILGGR